jgi:hypothetical protein
MAPDVGGAPIDRVLRWRHEATVIASNMQDTKGAAVMSAQTPYLQVDAIGVFPTISLLVVLLLAVMGIVAHAAFL